MAGIHAEAYLGKCEDLATAPVQVLDEKPAHFQLSSAGNAGLDVVLRQKLHLYSYHTWILCNS